MTVLIQLTVAGLDTGPTFDIYSDADGYLSAFETMIPKAQLVEGFLSGSVPDGTTIIKIVSHDNPVCTNTLSIPIVGYTTTTTSTTAVPTTTTTTTSGARLRYQIANGECVSEPACPVSFGEIRVNGSPVYAWNELSALPVGPITIGSANFGDIIQVVGTCHNRYGSSCVDITPSISLGQNGIQVDYAEGINGSIDYTFTYDEDTILNIEIACVA